MQRPLSRLEVLVELDGPPVSDPRTGNVALEGQGVPFAKK